MLDRIVRLAMDVVATRRLTRIINEDYVTQPIREAVWKKFPAKTSKIGYLFTCDWCMSIWAGVLIFSLRHKYPEIADVVSGILTASQITGHASFRGW